MRVAGRSGRLGRSLAVLLAWLLILVGLVLTPTPLPIGLLLVGAGLLMLLANSRLARRTLRRMRVRYPGFSGKLVGLETRLGRGAAVLLRRTNPHRKHYRTPR